MEVTERNEIDAAWAIEAEDRIDAFERGELTAIPAEEVFDAIEKNKPGGNKFSFTKENMNE